jgi:16S rRNA (adenine1518-N6/adenine1519-N6)-dimethyltransferase
VLVANLPYNVATPLVADVLDHVPAVVRMLVMVQREVAERLAAGVGDEGYGAVSVKVSYWATARLAGAVPRSVFLPKPNVDSALVAIERRAEPATDAPRERLFELVRAGFGQRRKMLRRSLDGLVDAAAFECADVRPEARAEELDVVAWGRLATCAS